MLIHGGGTIQGMKETCMAMIMNPTEETAHKYKRLKQTDKKGRTMNEEMAKGLRR